MRYRFLCKAGYIVCAAALSATCLVGAATSQQPGSQSGTHADIAPLGWIKLCRKYAVVTTKDHGKEQNKDVNICLTKNEATHINSGKVLSSLAVRQIDGEEKQHLMVTVPLEMNLRSGVLGTVFPKTIWEKSQKGYQLSKADEANLRQLKLVYTQCHPAGCDGEIEATPQLINDLKVGGGFVVFAFNGNGEPVTYPIPLAGFDKAYTDPPMTERDYGEARRKLMRQVEQQPEIKGTIMVPKQLR